MSLWTCPKCGLQIDVKLFPVRCACGHVGTCFSDALRRDRMSACEHCNYYKSGCCAKMDMGCRRGYRRALLNPAAECPEGKWPQSEYQPIKTRHCLYHVYPSKANDHWMRNIHQLTKRAFVFNGHKVAAVATNENSHSFAAGSQLLRDHGFQCYEFRNDPVIRESATFLQLLMHIATPAPNEAAFFAHTKGGPRPGGPSARAIAIWRNVMYRQLLDGWQECMSHLTGAAFVGTHRQRWEREGESIAPTGIDNKYRWIFSGTFWWFRSDVVFNSPWREALQVDRYGVEWWPGNIVPADKGVSVYQPWSDVVNSFNPYELSAYPEADQYLAEE